MVWLLIVACTGPLPGETGGAQLSLGPEVECAAPLTRDSSAYTESILPDLALATHPEGEQYEGGGLAAADLNGDGRIDLYLPRAGSDQLYLQGEDGSFALANHLLPERAVGENDRSVGATAADFDADGDFDLVVTGMGDGLLLLANDEGTFLDATPGSGLDQTFWHGISATVGDVDGDGHLDLFVANHYDGPEFEDAFFTGEFPPGHPDELYLGGGDLGFTSAAERLPDALLGDAFSMVAGLYDLSGDILPELYVVNDFGPQTVPNLVATGTGTPPDQSAVAGLNVALFGMGLGAGDLNGDDRPDFVVTSWNQIVLLESDESGWHDSATARGLTAGSDNRHVAWGAELVDLDNDGDLDVPVAYGFLAMPDDAAEKYAAAGLGNPRAQPDAIFLQNESGQFVESAALLGLDDPAIHRGFVSADLNADGWIDLAFRSLGGDIRVWMANCGVEHWIEVDLGPAGLGAMVDVYDGTRTQRRYLGAGSTNFASSGPPIAHFGLGTGTIEAVEVTITWADGTVERHTGVPINRIVKPSL